jgi:hypothetical protein
VTNNNEPFQIELLHRAWQWPKRWRLEIYLALAASSARTVLARNVGWGLADLVFLTAVPAAFFSPMCERWLRTQLQGATRRRRWETALAGVCAPATPTVMAVEVDGTGEWARLRIRGGSTVADLAARAEALAAWMAVPEVRVRRQPDNAAIATVRALQVDPLAGPGRPWPWATIPATSLWQPVPVGVDEDGRPVRLGLFEHNLLVGGEPGAGKSVAVSQLVAAAALDPTAMLWLLDGKLVELAAWRHCAQGFAGIAIAEATGLLRQVQQHMDERYQWLLEAGQRKVPPGTGLHVVVVDELAHYLTWPEKKARDAFGDVLRDLVSWGRAAGVVVIAATQKPASDVVPTSLRDLFGYRWALRCTTNAASDTILGSGWATNGVTAASINPGLRGAGWLLHESGEPARLRAYHLDDQWVTHIAARAAHLRQHGHDDC